VFEGKGASRNYLRFRISPDMSIAMGVTVMGPSESLGGKAIEMVASHRPRPEEMDAYERVLSDAMAGDSSHFAREDYVEEAWRIVDPVLKNPPPIREYEPNTWGPLLAGDLANPPGGWHDPEVIAPGASQPAAEAA
jgi:glucose-6-phosphate 1-dehydrogenase